MLYHGSVSRLAPEPALNNFQLDHSVGADHGENADFLFLADFLPLAFHRRHSGISDVEAIG